MNIISMNINDIIPNENQPRKFFDEVKLKELSDSILEYGLLQPIIVCKKGDKYQIIAGERRYLACRLANLSEVDVIIHEVDRFLQEKLAILENIQREDLTAIEEANAYRVLIDDYGLSQIEVANAMKKRPSTISNLLRLLKLNQSVQDQMRENKLSGRHGRALLGLNDEDQVKFMQKAIDNNLTVSELEKSIVNYKKRPTTSKVIASSDYRLAINTIKHAMQMITKSGFQTDYNDIIEDDELVITIRVKKE